MRWWKKKPTDLMSVWDDGRFVLVFLFRRHGDRFQAIILNETGDIILPGDWASVAELESEIVQRTKEYYEMTSGCLIVFANYHARSRTMFIMTRRCLMDWQMTPAGKAEVENDFIGAGENY